MLRTMREGSQRHPWILWTILILIAVTFVIVGAWDYQGSPANAVAEAETAGKLVATNGLFEGRHQIIGRRESFVRLVLRALRNDFYKVWGQVRNLAPNIRKRLGANAPHELRQALGTVGVRSA